MLFLIEYDRDKGKVIEMSRFTEFERQVANAARLELELKLNRRGIEHEIVLLEAEDEEALRRTHRRYFENLLELAS
jgi:hypothetical protein